LRKFAGKLPSDYRRFSQQINGSSSNRLEPSREVAGYVEEATGPILRENRDEVRLERVSADYADYADLINDKVQW